MPIDRWVYQSGECYLPAHANSSRCLWLFLIRLSWSGCLIPNSLFFSSPLMIISKEHLPGLVLVSERTHSQHAHIPHRHISNTHAPTHTHIQHTHIYVG